MTALAVALLLTPVCRRIAIRTGFVAIPSAKGIHREPTPVLGGVAIFFAVFFALFVAGGFSGALPKMRALGFLGGGALVFVMGVIDDRVDLSWFSKLLGQIVAAILLLASDNASGVFLTPGGLVLSLLWLVGLANAMNFLDNMDGVCSGITVVVAAVLGALALLAGQPETALLAGAVCGASLGFLRFNFFPARIFLGDGGSLFLGYSLASLGLMTTRSMDFTFALLVPVIALAYPIFDITFVSVTRVARGQSLTQGGRDHTSHRLGRLLGDARLTSVTIYAICAALGAIAVGLHQIAFPPATIVTFLAVAFAFFGFGMRLSRSAPVPKPPGTAAAGVSPSSPRRAPPIGGEDLSQSRTVRVGCRDNDFCRAQTGSLLERIAGSHPKITFEVIDLPGSGEGEHPILEALGAGVCDLHLRAVRELPIGLPEDVVLAAVTRRNDPFDVLIAGDGQLLEDLPEDAILGVESSRVAVQLKSFREDIRVQKMKGTIDRLMQHLSSGEIAAFVTAAEDVETLGWEESVVEFFHPDMVLPAAGQGCFAILGRAGDDELIEEFATHDHLVSRQVVLAERAFLRELNVKPTDPVAVHGRFEGETLVLEAMLADEISGAILRDDLDGDPSEEDELGIRLAKLFIADGARDYIASYG